MPAAISESASRSLRRSLSLDRLDLIVLGGIGLATLLRLAVAASAGLSEDEAYYWLWSRDLQPGYYDHPPMVAYWIRAGTDVLGRSEIAIRLAASLGLMAASWLFYRTALVLFGDRRVGANAVLWFNACLLISVGGVIITPDTPLICFWVLCLFALAKIEQTGDARWWLVFGFSAGLALVSKYTGFLLAPVTLLWLAGTARGRRWFSRMEPYLAALIAAMMFTPVMWWNERHDWISFAKQWRHAAEPSKTLASDNLAHFLSGQIWVITPIMFGFLIAAMILSAWRGWRKGNAALLLASLSSTPLFLFFLYHAAGHRIEANWAAPFLPGAILAATALWSHARRQVIFMAAPALGLLLTLLAYGQAATALLPLPPRIDPTTRLDDWRNFATALADRCRAERCDFILTSNYQLNSELAFYLPEGIPVYQAFQPMRYVEAMRIDDGILSGKTALYVADLRKSEAGQIAPKFAAFESLGTIERKRAQQTIADYRIDLAKDYRGGLAQ